MDTSLIALPDLLRDRAAACPDRVLFQDVTGGAETFAQVLAQVYGWASALRALGVGDGDRIGVMLPVSMAAHHVWLACGMIKAWEVPINTAFKGPILAHILNDSQCRIVVMAQRYLPQLMSARNELKYLDTVIIPDLEGDRPHLGCRVLGRGDLTFDTREPKNLPTLGPEDVATVMYTSGTTGPSKGCVLPWGEFYWGLDLFGPEKDGSDCHYCPFPTNHLSGKVPIYNMITYKGRVVLRERYSTSDFWPDVRRFGCTTTLMLGAVATFLNAQPVQDDDADNPIKAVLMAPIIADYKNFTRRFDIKIVASYGMTEIAWPFILTDGQLPNHETCGRLRPEWDVRIVDDAGQDVAVGKAGELWARCSRPHSMMREYLGRPQATAEAWEGGFFHTGDAFRCDDQGYYYFVDRLKDAIRRRGENISSYEVENYVRSHPDVFDCAAVAVAAPGGEDDLKIVVVRKPGKNLDAETLIAYLLPVMPDFMVPRYVEFKPELPLTATNKVRKVDLRKEGLTQATWDRLGGSVKSNTA